MRGAGALRETARQAPFVSAGAGRALSLQQQVGNRAVAQMLVQRFGSKEHQMLGDKGSGVGKITLAPGLDVSFGHITALAGDFFGSVDQIKKLASQEGDGRTVPGTRDEIHYALFVKLLGKETDADYGPLVVKAVTQRYYTLAGTNRTHFTNPGGLANASVEDLASARDSSPTTKKVEEAYGRPAELKKGGVATTNVGSYRENHRLALLAAARAGRQGGQLDEAMLYEAFASHFLTDASASGHTRTPRDAISGWWNPRVPMFWHNLKLWMAERIAKHMNDNSTAGALTVQVLWEQARSTLEGVLTSKGIPDLTFGDVVAGAVHDRDNHEGVEAMVGSDVVTLLGDGQLLERGNPTQQGAGTIKAATAALQVSVNEIHKAYALGKEGRDAAGVVETFRLTGLSMRPGLFAAEQLWPMPLSDKDPRQGHPSLDWKQPTVGALFSSGPMRHALRLFANEKAADLGSEITLDPPLKEAKEKAMKESVLDVMRGGEDQVVKMLWAIVNYTPGAASGALGGVGGHDDDDNAYAYYKQARSTKGGLQGLTVAQKARLIRQVLSGATVGGEETMIVDLLLTRPEDIAHLVNMVGWRSLWADLSDSSLGKLVHDVGPRYWRTQGLSYKSKEIGWLAEGFTSERAEELIIVILSTCSKEEVRMLARKYDLDWNLDGAEQDRLDALRR